MKTKEVIEKFDYIDALRGIAILLVILIHTGQKILNLPQYASWIVTSGRFGVQLFFIISAFTLFLSLEKRFKIEKSPIKNFFIRRFFRIAPLFYIAIIFYAIFFTYFPFRGFNLKDIISSFFFLNTVIPSTINEIPPGVWSISVEVFFYLLLPFLFFRIKTLKKAILFFIFSIIVSVFINFLVLNLSPIFLPNFDKFLLKIEFLYYWIFNQLPIFALGIITFFVIKEKISRKTKITLSISAFILILLLILFPLNYQFSYQGIFPEQYLVFSILFVFLIYAMSKYKLKILNNKFTQYIGKISFSLYIWHFFIADLFRKTFESLTISPILNLIIFFIFTLFLSSLISHFTYKYIEQKGIKLGSNIIKKLEKSQNKSLKTKTK